MRIKTEGQPPAAVSLAEFKAATPMAESEDFDFGLTLILAAATTTIETATARPLVVREVEFQAPLTSGGAWTRWWFPVAPVQSITAVSVYSDGAWVDLDAADYRLDCGHDEPQLVLADSVRSVYAAAPVRVTALCGHDLAAVPMTLKQAVILVAQEWHAAGAGLGDAVPEVRSFAAHALIRQARYRRPKLVA